MRLAFGVIVSAAVVATMSAGCGAPAGRGTGDGSGSAGAGDEDAEREDGADSFVGGTWAPSASLARVEDIPRRGKVEERPSRTGAVRLVALMPVDGTGNHVVEIVGLPALDREVVVASLRAAHDRPQWAGCNELSFVADGDAQIVDDARHEGGVTPLGVQEAIQGRIPVSRLATVGEAAVLVVKSCDNEYTVEGGPALLAEFVARFSELTAMPTDDGAGDVADDESGAEAEVESAAP